MPIRRVHRDRPFLRNRQEKNENDGPRGKRGASDGATSFTGPQRPPTAANGGTAGTGPPMYLSTLMRQRQISAMNRERELQSGPPPGPPPPSYSQQRETPMYPESSPAPSRLSVTVETSADEEAHTVGSRRLFVLKVGLLIGSSIILAVLLLLALAKIKKRQMAAKDESGRVVYRDGVMVRVAADDDKGHVALGILAVPIAIIAVAIAAVLLFQHEQQILHSQRSRMNTWNWMKVGLLFIIVGLFVGYGQYIRTPPEGRPFHVSWRIFVYLLLGIVAMAMAKLANRATRTNKSKYGKS